MWPFTRKRYSLLETGLLKGATDWHCHILPGVDDGIRTIEEALEALSWYGEAGISEVWLTPHIMEDMPNETAALRDRFEDLKAAYNGSVKLSLASENMLDNLFVERLEAGDLLPVGHRGDTLLVETSYFNPPVEMHRLLEEISEKGFTPLLAHPERYVYMEMSEYRALCESGVRLQLNLPSLCGAYGRQAQKKAQDILREGLYSLCGSDLHRLAAFREAASLAALESDTLKLLEKLL